MRAANKQSSVETKQTHVWGKQNRVVQQEELNRKNRWIVENGWEILKNLYHELRQKKFQSFTIDNIHNLDTLYASIVAKWCQQLVKEGLYKGYVQREEVEMSQPQGQIDVQKTIQQQTLIRGTLVCNYDELSEDVYMNHVLKGTLSYFEALQTVQEEIKKEIKKVKIAFSTFDEIDIQRIKWKQIKYNNNTVRYKNLINLCKWVYDEKQASKTIGLDDTHRIYNLFKKSIAQILYKLYAQGQGDAVEQLVTSYTIDSEPEFETMFLKNQLMGVVYIKSIALIYLVKLQGVDYYNRDFQIQRKKLDELYKAMKKYEDKHKKETVGVLVQANIKPGDYNVDELSTSMVDGHYIGEITIDLWDKWRFIETRLNSPYNFFIQRNKEKERKG